MKRLVWLAPLLVSCGIFQNSPERHSSQDEGYQGYYADITQYRVITDRKTPQGIAIDDPSHMIDDVRLDTMVDELELCISRLPTHWTVEQEEAGHCLSADVPLAIRRDWIDVKVPSDWYISPCTQEPLFHCDADQKLCGQKPELGPYSDRPDCPCACRAAIQGNRTIVTTPKMDLFKATLARLVTGCNLPWSVMNDCLK